MGYELYFKIKLFFKILLYFPNIVSVIYYFKENRKKKKNNKKKWTTVWQILSGCEGIWDTWDISIEIPAIFYVGFRSDYASTLHIHILNSHLNFSLNPIPTFFIPTLSDGFVFKK